MPRLKPITKPAHGGCLCCPPVPQKIPLKSRIAVGFGLAAVTRNGKAVWLEGPDDEREDCWTVRKAEFAARKRPGDWRIVLHKPLSGQVYQRQGRNNWVLVEQNEGFA